MSTNDLDADGRKRVALSGMVPVVGILWLKQPAIDQRLQVKSAELGPMGHAQQLHQLGLAAGRVARRQKLALLRGELLDRARRPAATLSPRASLVSD